MQNSLLSGLSGLRANQQYLDVIGNNLANSTTPGFKSSSVLFSQALSQTLRPAAGPTGAIGGRNASQIGRGTSMGSIDVNMVQGSLLSTGRSMDLAIQGSGLFILTDGTREYYTRVGAFDIDSNNTLVDRTTGFKVLDTNGADVVIPLNSTLPPEATSTINFSGNLPAEFNGPLTELIQTAQSLEEHHAATLASNAGPFDLNAAGLPGDLRVRVGNNAFQTISLAATDFANPAAATAAELVTAITAANPSGFTAVDNGGVLELVSTDVGAQASVTVDLANGLGSAIFTTGIANGSEAVATLATSLNDLEENVMDYAAGDILSLTGSLPDGTAIVGQFTFGTGAGQDGTTVGDLVNKLQSMYTAASGGATVTFNTTTGNIEIEADDAGEAFLTLSIAEATGNTGKTNWNNYFFTTARQGTGPDTESVVTTVYDSAGVAHAITFELERQADGTWDLNASVDPNEGQVTTGTVSGLSFDENGQLAMVPTAELGVTWNNLPGSHAITLTLGGVGGEDGLTQFGLAGSVLGQADGSTAGTLASVGFRDDGVIEGFYSNGRIQTLQQLGVAIFSNPEGLEQLGDGLWGLTSNSGAVFKTAALEGPAGQITSGALEGSNVDIAEEFVRLIEAQRAFQASARIVSTTDEVLAELVNTV